MARGAAYLLASQIVIAIGQILYGSVTGRAFQPEIFGGFVAALSLQGILVVLTTAGLPSYALRSPQFHIALAIKLRLLAAAGGVISAGIYIATLPSWLTLLNAQNGYAQVIPLAIAQLISPMASLESAILRRQKGSLWDAATLTVSWLLGAVAACACIVAFAEDWALGIAVPVQAGTLLILATCGRSRASRERQSASLREIMLHTGAVTGAGVVSSLLGQSPAWFIGGAAGAGQLGQFSRANTIGSLPMTSIAGAFVRALAPIWHKTRPQDVADILRDVVILASCVLFFPAALISALAAPLMLLWLGPGWEQAGSFASLLAPAAAFGAVALVVQSSSELRGMFRPIRAAQVSAVIILATALALALVLDQSILVAVGVLASQLVLLVVIYLSAGKHVGLIRLQCLLDLTKQAAYASVVGLAAWATYYLSSYSMQGVAVILPLIFSVLMATMIWLGLLRLNRVNEVLKRRNLLPAWRWIAFLLGPNGSTGHRMS